MNTTMQLVSERYVSNLLRSGRNKEFSITMLEAKAHMMDGVIIGEYYQVNVEGPNKPMYLAVGVTPAQALRRALEKHGVTFDEQLYDIRKRLERIESAVNLVTKIVTRSQHNASSSRNLQKVWRGSMANSLKKARAERDQWKRAYDELAAFMKL